MVSAPKAGDAAEWARRAGKGSGGLDMLTRHAISGLGAMPPKGGHAELTPAQIRAAIVFMRAVPAAAGTAPAGPAEAARRQFEIRTGNRTVRIFERAKVIERRDA
jgi:hypothetical protein